MLIVNRWKVNCGTLRFTYDLLDRALLLNHHGGPRLAVMRRHLSTPGHHDTIPFFLTVYVIKPNLFQESDTLYA